MKAGQPRGKAFFKRMSQYMQKVGARKSIVQEKARPRYDKEFFVAQCKLQRQWCDVRAEQQWERLSSDQANIADEDGPPWSRLRVFVPTWMFCTETDKEQLETFQEKALTTSTGSKHMNADEIAAYRAELGKGFGKLDRFRMWNALTPREPGTRTQTFAGLK